MLTKKQIAKYWRTWSAICAAQGWRNGDDDRRYALHAEAGCPQSMRAFKNPDLDRLLEAAAPLMNKVDIRDRARERVEFAIEQLSYAIDAITAGSEYRRRIVLDMHNASSADHLPLDPIEDQQQDGRVHHYKATRAGKKAVYAADLENHKRLLKNRLSKLITRAKRDEIPMPAGILRPGWRAIPNNTLIGQLLARKHTSPPTDPEEHPVYLPAPSYELVGAAAEDDGNPF